MGIRSKQELHLFCFKTLSDCFTKLSLSPWVWFFDIQSKHALSFSERKVSKMAVKHDDFSYKLYIWRNLKGNSCVIMLLHSSSFIINHINIRYSFKEISIIYLTSSISTTLSLFLSQTFKSRAK